MTEIDPKYVTSTRPVNRRTAAKQSMQAQAVNPIVRERLALAQARNQFGAPLAEQLRPSDFAAHRKSLSSLSILGAVCSAASAGTLLLAGIQLSLPLAIVGGVALSPSLLMIFYGRRKAVARFQAPAIFDEASVQAFDTMMHEIASEVPQEIADQLSAIKQQLIRLARLSETLLVDENFTMDDRMYLTESVRRYLPDSLQSYLAIPQNQRSTQILEQGQTAVSLLLSQISLVQAELAKIEVKLTKSAANELVKQQRFLESKAKR